MAEVKVQKQGAKMLEKMHIQKLKRQKQIAIIGQWCGPTIFAILILVHTGLFCSLVSYSCTFGMRVFL